METGLAGLRREFAHAEESAASMGVRMDRINQRIEGIEGLPTAVGKPVAAVSSTDS